MPNSDDVFTVTMTADLWATIHGVLTADAKQILANVDRIPPSELSDALAHVDRMRQAAQAIDHHGQVHYAEH